MDLDERRTKKLYKKITILEKLVNDSQSINATLALPEGIAGKRNFPMTDASFTAPGFDLIIEDNDDRKLLSKRKTFAPVAFGSRVFSLRNFPMTDASFTASGFDLIIEDNDDRKLLSKRKTFAPVAFGSRVFSPSKLNLSN